MKVFSLPNSPHGSRLNTKRFNCSLTRTGDLVVGRGANSSKRLSENFDSSKLVRSKTNPNLSQLLIPELNIKFENEEAFSLLGHEGYQLK